MRRYTLAASILFHGLAVGIIIVAPMFAGIALPEPSRPIEWQPITLVEVVPPDLPPPRTRTADAPSASAAPATEPSELTPEVPRDPPADLAIGGGDADASPFVLVGDIGRGADAIPPPPPVADPAPRRVGGIIQAPNKTRHVAPVYPDIAKSARVEGTVILEAVISASGHVDQVRLLRSVPLLDGAAIEAVRQWRFTPTMLNGEAIPVVMTVTVTFALN